MESCSAVQEVTLRDLDSLHTIDHWSLTWCGNLNKCSLSNLPSLTEVGESFLADASELAKLHLEHLPKLEKISIGFLCQTPPAPSNADEAESYVADEFQYLSQKIEIQVSTDCHQHVIDEVKKFHTQRNL